MKHSVLILFGGESSEHEISIKSARNVFEAIDKEKYDVKLGYIDKNGKWWLLPSWLNNPTGQKLPQLVIAPGTGYLLTVPGSKVIHVDVVMPILHGKNGEDGTVQGLAKMHHVKIVGPSVINAAITMDKDVTKHLLRGANIPVVDWTLWRTYEPRPVYKTVRKKLGKTLFIKPANAGSSIGVSKVRNSKEFDAGLQYAAKHDTLVLIEKAIKGTEMQVAVLGNNEPQISEICEIESKTDFHDFEDKYNADSTVQFHIPARIKPKQAARIKKYALEAHSAVRGRGLARIDFFVVNAKTEYLNEINAIPGFTDVSVYPMLWRKGGIETKELIDTLIDHALEVE